MMNIFNYILILKLMFPVLERKKKYSHKLSIRSVYLQKQTFAESQSEDENLQKQIDLEDNSKKQPRSFKAKFVKELNKNKNHIRNRMGTVFFDEGDSLIEENKKSFRTIISSISSKFNITQKQVIIHDNVIHGTWKNDKLHGYVKINFADKAKFRGEYKNGIRMKGIYEFPNGNTYKGEFFGQRIQGKGILRLYDNTIIKGKWNCSSPQGLTTVIYPSGDIYYGVYENFRKNGFGYYYFSNGTKYIGEFNNGKIHGQGEFHDSDRSIKKGFWKNGELQQEPLKSLKQLKSRKSLRPGKSNVSFQSNGRVTFLDNS